MSALILLVDDEVSVLEKTSRALREAGYRVNTSMDGEDALEYMRTDRPDLVVTDNFMPGMNGSQMVAEMSGDSSLRSIPVVMHSSLWVPPPKGMVYWNSPKSHSSDEEDLLRTVAHVLQNAY